MIFGDWLLTKWWLCCILFVERGREMLGERKSLTRYLVATGLFCSLMLTLVFPGAVYADTVQSYTFESPGGYTTEHPSGTSYAEFSTGDDVFGRNNRDTNWDAGWGARTGDWFFGWRDPEGQDSVTDQPFIFVSNEIDISGYDSVQVSVYWRADGVFEDSGAYADILRMYLIEDSTAQSYFFDASKTDLDACTDWTEATETVPDSVNTIQIVIEGLNSAGEEYMAVDDITVTGNQATSITLSSFTARSPTSQATFSHRQWLALAVGLVLGGGAVAGRLRRR